MNPFRPVVIGTCDLCNKESTEITKDESKGQDQWVCKGCSKKREIEITFEDVVFDIPVTTLDKNR